MYLRYFYHSFCSSSPLEQLQINLKMATGKKSDKTEKASEEHLRLAAVVKDTHRALREQVRYEVTSSDHFVSSVKVRKDRQTRRLDND
jgi:hypothetical protein